MAAAAVALLLASASSKLDAFTHLAPVICAFSAAVFLFAALLRQRGVVLVLAGAAMIVSALHLVPETSGAVRQAFEPAPERGAPQLKLLSMNLWKNNHNIDAAEALIRREQPDIIVLIEAEDAWRELPIRLADDYAHMSYCMRQYWCNVIVLSKLDFIEDITPPNASALSAARMRLPDRLGGGPIEVVGVHAHWPWPAGRMQWNDFARLRDLVHTLDPETAIVAGDFNSTPWSNMIVRLDNAIPFPRRTRAFFTFPTTAHAFTPLGLRSPAPILPIDHVYAGRNWRLVELRRGPNIGSDHFPVIAVFTPKLMPRPALRGFSQAETGARP